MKMAERILSRRKIVQGLMTAATALAFPMLPKNRAHANPLFMFVLRFLFGQAFRRGATRLLSRNLLGRGGSRVLSVQRGRAIRSASRAELLENASHRERRWTGQFIASGLEEVVWQAITVEPASANEEIEIPANAPVYKISESKNAVVEIFVKNISNIDSVIDITMYLYDIDAGIVDQKYPYISAFVRANTNQRFNVSLHPLNHTGRKVLCVEQKQVDGRVSDIIYVL